MSTAAEQLVMAMESVAKNAGKTSFFGKDKGAAAYMKFTECLRRMIVASILDGQSSESDTDPHVAGVIIMVLDKFSKAYPNWPLAYEFAGHFFSDANRANCLALIRRIRS